MTAIAKTRVSKARKSAVRAEESPEYVSVTKLAREGAVIAEAMQILFDRASNKGMTFTDPQIAGKFMELKLAGLEREHFVLLTLDTRHRMIGCHTMFMGTVDGAEVHPRECAKVALMDNAAAVIIAHNHPSGDCEPSAADRAVTARLKSALALIEIRMLDHFVCGGGNPVSLAARGWV